MFVPSPYRSSNGTTNRDMTVSRAELGVTYIGLEEVIRRLETMDTSTSSTTRTYTSRTRGSMTSGITPTGYRNTPYINRSFHWKTSGSAVRVFRTKVGSNYNGHYGSARYGILPGTSSMVSTLTDIRRTCDFQHGQHGTAGVANNAIMSNLWNRAIAEARVKAARSKMDLSETMVDLNRSVRMVATRSSQIARAIRSIRNGDFVGAARALGINKRTFTSRTAAQAWLELQYGWRPLVSDIQAAVDLSHSTMSSRDFTVTRRLTQSLIEPRLTHPNFQVDGTWKGTANVEVKYQFRVSDPKLAYLASLNVVNPLYALWVRSPFSFVVDWLVPVSTWLQTMTSTLGLTYTGGYSCLKMHGEGTISFSRLRGNNSFFWEEAYERSDLKVEAACLSMRRYSHTSLPGYRPYIRFPVRTLTRAASAVALITALSR